MNFFSYQPDPKRHRFSIPNDVWKWELKSQGFVILAYLCFLHVHCNKDASPSADEIASQLHMSKDMAVKQLSELNRRGLLDQHMVPILESNSKNFFSLPNELFFLNIGHGAITVYAYLLYCENRRTHQCHPSCRTIAAAVHLSAATVMKHITKLEDQRLIAVENTSYNVLLSATKLLHHMGRIFQDNSIPPCPPGSHRTDRKLLQKIRQKKIALGHKPDDHEEEQNMGGMTMGGM